MVAFAQKQYGVSPSMSGADDTEVFELAEHLRTNAPLGIEGKEAFRMADAQRPEHRPATMRIAVEVAMRELLKKAA